MEADVDEGASWLDGVCEQMVSCPRCTEQRSQFDLIT